MSDEQRPILFDREALIIQLKGDERFRALAETATEAEKAWMEKVAHLLIHSTKPVDQRKIDYMRGYFAGARYYTGGRVTTAEIRMSQQGIHEEKESDA